MERMDGQPDNCGDPSGKECLFKVFDINNQIIYQETRSVCPTAEVVPCYYDPTKEKSINVNPSQYSISNVLKGLIVQNFLFDIENRKGTVVEIAPYPFPQALPPLPQQVLGRQRILELYSPEGCSLYPKICWECNSCNSNRKCPDGTCLKAYDRKTNRICCYGSNGKVIGFADPECESKDCDL